MRLPRQAAAEVSGNVKSHDKNGKGRYNADRKALFPVMIHQPHNRIKPDTSDPERLAELDAFDPPPLKWSALRYGF